MMRDVMPCLENEGVVVETVEREMVRFMVAGGEATGGRERQMRGGKGEKKGRMGIEKGRQEKV